MADNESQDTKCPCISTAKGLPLPAHVAADPCVRHPPLRFSVPAHLYLSIYLSTYLLPPTYLPTYTYLSSPCITGDDNSLVDEAIPTYRGIVTRETNEDTNCWKCLSLDQRGNKRTRARTCPTISTYLSCGDALSTSACPNISIITSMRCDKAVDSLVCVCVWGRQ